MARQQRPSFNDRNIAGIHTKADNVAAKALADAITTSRQGQGAAQTGMYAGTLDRRRLARVATGNLAVFQRPIAPRPNKVRVTILVDASVSMHHRLKRPGDYAGFETGPRRYEAAAQVARDLAEATDLLDWVTADMLAFTTGWSNAQQNDAVLCFPIWETGEQATEVDSLGNVPMGYTEEGYAIAMAWDEMRERLQGDEQGLVIIISDGAPGEGDHVRSVVADMERDGIPVVSVALVPSAAQPLMYGADNVVDFNGSTIALGYDMAKVIGGVL